MTAQVVGMMEQGIVWLQQAPPWGVLLLMFLIAYIENIFPPAPSDMLLVFAGTMIGFGTVDFSQALAAATIGSTTGFMTAYLLGRGTLRVILSEAGSDATYRPERSRRSRTSSAGSVTA
jgi:membrane protein DedA with SNARE-associated domain